MAKKKLNDEPADAARGPPRSSSRRRKSGTPINWRSCARRRRSAAAAGLAPVPGARRGLFVRHARRSDSCPGRGRSAARRAEVDGPGAKVRRLPRSRRALCRHACRRAWPASRRPAGDGEEHARRAARRGGQRLQRPHDSGYRRRHRRPHALRLELRHAARRRPAARGARLSPRPLC